MATISSMLFSLIGANQKTFDEKRSTWKDQILLSDRKTFASSFASGFLCLSAPLSVSSCVPWHCTSGILTKGSGSARIRLPTGSKGRLYMQDKTQTRTKNLWNRRVRAVGLREDERKKAILPTFVQFQSCRKSLQRNHEYWWRQRESYQEFYPRDLIKVLNEMKIRNCTPIRSPNESLPRGGRITYPSKNTLNLQAMTLPKTGGKVLIEASGGEKREFSDNGKK